MRDSFSPGVGLLASPLPARHGSARPDRRSPRSCLLENTKHPPDERGDLRSNKTGGSGDPSRSRQLHGASRCVSSCSGTMTWMLSPSTRTG